MFLVVTVNAGPACDAAVRALCGDLAALLRAIRKVSDEVLAQAPRRAH